MADYLPHDVLIEVFMRATTETLVRCTCVCKHWQSIITHPDFIETHLKRQKTREFLIIRTCPLSSQMELYTWHSDDAAFTKSDCRIPLGHPYNRFYHIVGSCNGILCLTDGHPYFLDDTILWNPTIRKWMKLPPLPSTYEPYDKYDHGVGFGFDVASNDYKVIRIIYHKRNINIVPEVVIYSLNSGTWKKATHLASGIKHLKFKQENQAFVNGATHWIVYHKRTLSYSVLSYHLSDELFRHIDLPTQSGLSKLIVIEGQLVIADTQTGDIWTMKEYGVVSSWTRKFTDLSFPPRSCKIIGFKKNCQFLLDYKGALCSYDIYAEDLNARTRVKELGLSSRYSGEALQVESFVESIVLIGRPTYVED